MRKANLLSGVFLMLLSLALLFWIIPWQVEETFDGAVSPRLLPQICAAGIGLLSLVLIITNLRTPAIAADKSPLTWPDVRAVLTIGGLLAVGIFLFSVAGPIVASTVLIVGILLAMGERRLLPLILMPVVLMTGSWVLFYKILGTAIQ
ncbi:MAG: tripartite tricarboxylate transporter TctB family protein [Burkholderiaceae bacterium]